MKKRLLTLLLAVVMVIGLFPMTAYGSNVVTPPPGTNYNTEANAASKSSAFSKAHVQNLGATTGTNGTARQLQVVIQPKGSPTATSVFAIVMRRTDYNRIMPNGPAAEGLSGGTYSNLDGTLGAGAIPYYGMARGLTASNSTAAMTLDVVVASGANDAILSQGGATTNIRKSFTAPTANRNESTYFDEYVLIAFGADRTGDLQIQPGEDKDANYYIDYFYMDANGYVLTPSYGVRYNTNDPYPYDKTNTGIKDQYSPAFSGTLPTGSLTATNVTVNGSSRNATVTWIQRAKWNADMSEGSVPAYNLMPAANSPTRTGYSFVGWSTEPIRPLKVGEDVTTVLPAGAKLYTAGEAYPKAGDPQPTLYQIHDLYAVWRTVPVQFGDTVGGIKGVEAEKENGHWVINYPDNKAPQFGVAFTTNPVNLAAPSSTTNNQPNGVKVYSTVTYKDGVKDPTPKLYGLTVGRNGNNNTTQWLISGTPNDNSDDKPVKFEITVTDESNGTRDTIIVKFTKVKKGAQPVPTKDANTGLESRIETVRNEESGTEVQDGQIFGFYSKGPTIGNDTGYLGTAVNGANTNVSKGNGTVGTGTMTDYYIDKRMIYQYRPTKVVTVVDGEKTETEIPWTAYEDETDPQHAAAVTKMAELGYDKMPNDGWREVPMPKNWYASNSLAQNLKDSLAASLLKNATTLVTTGYAPSNSGYAPISVLTAPAGFTGWLDSYGYIEWAATEPQAYASPVVHGLTADSVYEIRFRANSNNEVSPSQTITIGGVAASSGGGSSAGLLFNLMRGSVWQIPKPQEQVPQDVTTINVTMGEGGTATITNVKLEEATEPTPETPETTADEGEEPGTDPGTGEEPTPEPTSVTITEAGTKTLTVLGQPVTVTVTPAEGFETHTVTVTADEAPLTPAEGVYTLPAKTVTGALALNISLTAPTEPEPPAPETRAAVTTDTDVTDTLFAASPTGALPDGSALGLGEGETLQLRDPEGEIVDSITFYVSATGSVENTDGGAGLFDTYVCTLNETKTALVWTKVVNEVSTSVTGVDLGGTFKSLAAQFGGKANPSDFAAIVFNDWDGKLIGSTVVPKGDASEAVTAFEQIENVSTLLKSHVGYDFLTWVKNEDNIPTSYGKRVSSTANVNLVDLELDPANKVNFAQINESITVKAAYTTNGDCILGDSNDDLINRDARRYTTSVSSYGRFGIGDSFSVTIKVERGAVPRPTNAALRVRMEINGVSVYSMYSLSGADIEYVEVAPYAVANKSAGFSGVSVVEWTVIDTYGVTDWIGAAARTTEAECQARASFTVKALGTSSTTYAVWDEGTYPFYGVAVGINDTLKNYHELKLQNPEITPTNSNMAGITTGILRSAGMPPKVTNALQLRIALYEGWLEKGLDTKELTSVELYDVIYEIASGQPRS